MFIHFQLITYFSNSPMETPDSFVNQAYTEPTPSQSNPTPAQPDSKRLLVKCNRSIVTFLTFVVV